MKVLYELRHRKTHPIYCSENSCLVYCEMMGRGDAITLALQDSLGIGLDPLAPVISFEHREVVKRQVLSDFDLKLCSEKLIN